MTAAVARRVTAILAGGTLIITLGCLHFLREVECGEVEANIRVNPLKSYQTIEGWEAMGWVDQFDDRYRIENVHRWREEAARLAADVGVTRVRIEVHSNAENPRDYFTPHLKGELTRKEWKKHLYQIVNDNDDPFVINPEGFHFSQLDYNIENAALPLRKILAERGEKLYVNLNYVDFGNSPFELTDDPEEYAEFMVAVFQHLDAKYGWVPDGLEVILEPDNRDSWTGGMANWTGEFIGRAIAATAKRLKSAGYSPDFIAPSTVSMSMAGIYFEQIVRTPGVFPAYREFSYHRYRGVSDRALRAIVSKSEKHDMKISMLEWWDKSNSHETLHEDLKKGRNSVWHMGILAGLGEPDGTVKIAAIDKSDAQNPRTLLNPGIKLLRQYFHYVRPGAKRVEAMSDRKEFDPLAFRKGEGDYVVVVKAEKKGKVAIKGLPPGRYGINYTTGRPGEITAYAVDLPSREIEPGKLLVGEIPDRGVITFYWEERPASPANSLR